MVRERLSLRLSPPSFAPLSPRTRPCMEVPGTPMKVATENPKKVKKKRKKNVKPPSDSWEAAL